jgi:hypothetical protein
LILARKALLVVVSMFNTTHVERGWWIMSLIQITAICAQLLVMPYRDYVTNMYELLREAFPLFCNLVYIYK